MFSQVYFRETSLSKEPSKTIVSLVVGLYVYLTFGTFSLDKCIVHFVFLPCKIIVYLFIDFISVKDI